ncbi:MAG: aspartate aminotransferase family protein, partial [Microthrixaceae bacterium]|nr:aspartate aminotransferase family protein [Microthrixaceae bacterium]
MPFTLPATGRDTADILAEVTALAEGENQAWEDGRCSGTMYCGDFDHYEFMADVFAKFGHANALQRDMCPSATQFEGGIIDMTLDMLGANGMPEGSDPVGMVTSGGSGSILHAVLAYREAATARGITTPNFLRPETAHPAFDKACHLL